MSQCLLEKPYLGSSVAWVVGTGLHAFLHWEKRRSRRRAGSATAEHLKTVEGDKGPCMEVKERVWGYKEVRSGGVQRNLQSN